jgi:outer membrane receptor protein involved in Fe transport
VAALALLAALPGRIEAQQADPAASPKDVKAKHQATAKKPAPDTGKPRFTEQIVVTATRSEREVESLPLAATVIDRKEIEGSASFHVDDLLRSVGGVDLPNGGSATQYPTRNMISMRGLGVGRALVLLDGVPLNDPMSGNVDWNRITPGDLDRIEVIRGASASLFGDSAMGGTISLVSKPVSKGELDADVSGGSFDTRRATLRLGRAVASGVKLGVDLLADNSDGYDRIPQAMRRPVDTPSWWRGRGASLRADFDLGSGAGGSLRAGYHSYDLSQGTALSWDLRHTADFAAAFHAGERDSGELKMNVFYIDDRFDVQNVRIDDSGTQASLSGRFHNPSSLVGGSAQWSRALGGRLPLLMVGLDLRQASAATFRRNYGTSGSLTSTQNSGGRQDSAGIFAQASWTPVGRLEVLSSARLDTWRNRDGYDDVSSGGRTDFASRRVSELSPRLALRYELSPALALRGALYRGFGAPTLSDLYRSSAFRGQENLANPALVPETTRGGELGCDVTVPRWRVQFTVFSNTISDVITPVILSREPDLVLQPRNLGTARSRGAELTSESYLGDRWTVSFTYDWTDARTLESPGSPEVEGTQLPEVPRQAASLTASYRLANGGTVSSTAIYVARKFADAANTLAYDSHTLVDCFFSWPLSNHLEVYVAATNLFDEVYLDDRTPTTRRGAPREVRLGLRIRTSFIPSLSGNGKS